MGLSTTERNRAIRMILNVNIVPSIDDAAEEYHGSIVNGWEMNETSPGCLFLKILR